MDPRFRISFQEARLDDFFRSAISARDCAMNRPVMSGGVGSLAGKEKRILHRSRKRGLCPIGSNFGVTVRPSRKRISLPVMDIGGVKRTFKILHWQTEQIR